MSILLENQVYSISLPRAREQEHGRTLEYDPKTFVMSIKTHAFCFIVNTL